MSQSFIENEWADANGSYGQRVGFESVRGCFERMALSSEVMRGSPHTGQVMTTVSGCVTLSFSGWRSMTPRNHEAFSYRARGVHPEVEIAHLHAAVLRLPKQSAMLVVHGDVHALRDGPKVDLPSRGCLEVCHLKLSIGIAGQCAIRGGCAQDIID